MDHFFELPTGEWSKLHYDIRAPTPIAQDVLCLLKDYGHATFIDSDKAIQCELISKFVFESNAFEGVGDSWLATKACIDSTVCANGPIDNVDEIAMKVEACLQTKPADASQQLKRRQIVQHLAAYAHMCHSPLEFGLWNSVDGIKHLHRVLTTGLEDADPDASVQPGYFRSSARYGIGIGPSSNQLPARTESSHVSLDCPHFLQVFVDPPFWRRQRSNVPTAGESRVGIAWNSAARFVCRGQTQASTRAL